MEYIAIIGTAFEVEPDYPEVPYLRLYRKAGRTFMGYQTHENVYLCSEKCLNTWLNDWTMTANDGNAYLRSWELAKTGPGTEVRTADVISAIDRDFDYPAECEVCQHDRVGDSEERAWPLFTLTVHCDSAAFGEADEELREELARILRKLADDVLQGRDTGKFENVHDLNGNPVGKWRLLAEE